MAKFNVVYEGTHGRTVHSDDPRADAVLYVAAMWRSGITQAGHTNVFNTDGSVTVHFDDLLPLTFENGQIA